MRFRWCGHRQRRDVGGDKQKKKTKDEMSYMDMVREYIKFVGVTENDAEDKKRWKWRIRGGDL